MGKKEMECCPEFNPEIWDGKILEWNNKNFIRSRVFTLFYVPVNFGAVITKTIRKAENAGAAIPDWLCISDHTSKWNMDIYLAVDRPVGGADNVTLSGKYLSKVYEGSFRDTGKWCDDFRLYAGQLGLSIEKWYMWYTTCPKCAKKYGKNYVAVIGRIGKGTK